MDISQLQIDPSLIKLVDECVYEISIGFVPNMKVPGRFYSTPDMAELAFQELNEWLSNRNKGLPSIIQIAFVATLPGITKYSYGMPDMHSGYGFSIGGVAAFDTSDPNCIISPGGVGYDINCGVRCFTTHLSREQVEEQKEKLINTMSKKIPSGVGGKLKNFMDIKDLPDILAKGSRWAVEHGYGVSEDIENCEEHGCMKDADPSLISRRALSRGNGQLGTIGAGNHYVEVQYIEKIYDEEAAKVMGLKEGEVVCMIHTGSRGLGHQIADDFIKEMEKNCDDCNLPDKQLSSAQLKSDLGQRYYKSMCAAANFAWCNRQVITHFAHESFKEVFGTEDKMDLIYDAAHNIAKIENHEFNGVKCQFIVHRKGATRAFGKDREEIPARYKGIGQPVLIGGSLGTSSYILVGTEGNVNNSFSSTCHGAGRAMSRSKALHSITAEKIEEQLKEKGIELRAANAHTVIEEAPETYKDVDSVIEACDTVGVSKKVARLVPIAVIKG